MPAAPQDPSSSSSMTLFQAGPIDHYFKARNSGYEPSSEISVLEAFQGLAISEGWSKKRRNKERQRFHVAVDAEFSERVGSGSKLLEWQRLAKVIGLETVPSSITQCRKAIQKENINIYHVLNAYRRATQISDLELIKPSTEIIRFKTVKELREYTIERGMIYQKSKAKGTVLRGLLKHIF